MTQINQDNPNFIDLTLLPGDKISINALLVSAVYPLAQGGCEVTSGGTTWEVHEGPGGVLKTIRSIQTSQVRL